MFGFGKSKNVTQAPEQPAAPVMVEAPSSGKLSLSKGSAITLEKKAAPVIVKNGWTAHNKDYDLKALVRYHDGRCVYVGAANRDETLRTSEGAVVHSGDAKRAGETETLTISWHPDIASIAVSSYSALENGKGSFREYGVYVEIQNGSQVVGINAADTSAKGNSYTLCFGEILFGSNGELTVINHELYSRGGSERRVAYVGNAIVMDAGPEGQRK